MSNPVNSLNPAQQAAVDYIQSPLLVLAGAGSGKTRVITQKIAWLIRSKKFKPQHIFAITFTNKAAKEMKERTLGILKNQNTRGLSISTFHTLGLKILQQELSAAGLRAGFSIFDSADSAHLIKELDFQTLDDKEALKIVQAQISAWKNQLITPEQALVSAKEEEQQRYAVLYQQYQDHLQAYNAVDFDDLILKPVLLLQNLPHCLERWQNKIRYLLVDEYQDTNGAQYTLIKLLVGVRGGITVVGDDDQSIYAWRGARPENIMTLKADYPTLKVIKLEQNYRSSRRILRAANQLISHNPHLFEKKLWSDLGEGDPLRVLACGGELKEAERVATEIMSHRYRHNNQYQDYAILYRSNHQSRIIEQVLRSQNIPYFLSGGTAFFSRVEIKDIMAYLRLIANPDDDSAFLRIVNIPRRKIGAATLAKLSHYAGKRQVNLLQACQELGLSETIKGATLGYLSSFAQLIQRYAKKADINHPGETIRQLLAEINYEYWIYENANNEKAAKRQLDNVQELINWLEHILKSKQGGNTLAELVRDLLLRDILERQEDETGDQVSLMTLHAAKGLEFPHVFLIGMEEEILPHRNSIENDDIEEERRLAYVGITRAQRSLTLSYAMVRQKYGEKIACDASRFIDELPEADLEWIGGKKGKKKSAAEQKATGRAHLANLTALLEAKSK